MRIDTERVIIEVQLRPCLWDKYHELYKSRDARDAAWKDILKKLAPNFESLSEEEKNNADKKIQQRWRTARDSYCKEKSSEKKQPSSGSQKKKKYGFYDMLTFLDKTTDTDVDEPLSTLSEELTQDSSSQSGSIDLQSTNHQPSSAGIQPSTSGLSGTHSTRQELTKTKNNRGNSEFKAELLKYLKSRDLVIPKDDLAFYKSIQPILNGFSMHKKLMFRQKVLHLLIEMECNRQPNSDSINYDSKLHFSGTNQTDQNMQHNLVAVNETDQVGASAPEIIYPRPLKNSPYVHQNSGYDSRLLNQTPNNTSEVEEKDIDTLVIIKCENQDIMDTDTYRTDDEKHSAND